MTTSPRDDIDPVSSLTPKQAAARLGVSHHTVIRWIRTGKLPAVQLAGYLYRIRTADLEALVQPVQTAADESGSRP